MSNERKSGGDNSQTASCFTCRSREQAEWCALSECDRRAVDETKVVRQYMPGDILYSQGAPCDGVYCIEAGLVGLRKVDRDGNSILVRLAYPGDIIGYRSCLADEDHNLSAEALKPVSVCFVNQAAVRTMLANNPALGMRFMKSMARDLNDAEDRFLESTSANVRARLAHLLFELKDRFAVEFRDGHMILELPLSRQDMAAMIGVRPESMSRAIRKFEDEGLAFFSGRTVRVPRVTALFAGIESVNIHGDGRICA